MSVCLHVAFCVVKCSLIITNCFISNTGNVNGQDPIMFFLIFMIAGLLVTCGHVQIIISFKATGTETAYLKWAKLRGMWPCLLAETSAPNTAKFSPKDRGSNFCKGHFLSL